MKSPNWFFIFLAVLVLLAALPLEGEENNLPGAKFGFVSPYGRGVDRIVKTGEEKGWARVALVLRQIALNAYRNNEVPAEQWYFLYRWSRLLAKKESDFIHSWVENMNRSRLGHANMVSDYFFTEHPLGERLSTDLKVILLSNITFSREFFGLLKPADNLLETFAILETLYRDYPTYFEKYKRLALALAVVYDVPPPPGWPHFQVPERLLPRRLPDPSAAFQYWTRLNEKRRSAHDLSRLSAEKLKFLIDTPAGFDELRWAYAKVKDKTADFAKVYSRVPYRVDRVEQGRFIWSGSDYRLQTVLQKGGICVDQAYFASQAGKARGIPTLIFRGAGMTGRHAWFGFLRKNGRWEFDAGRYGDNRYVTGYAHDPQTWADISDHELTFLAEGFHSTHYYRKSVYHSNFAVEFLALPDLKTATAAAEKALRFERRNQAAWETLVKAARIKSDNPRDVEVILRRAVRAFANYPDLEAYYLNLVNESLVARGEFSRARLEKNHVVTKNKAGRTDLSITETARILKESLQYDPLHVQLRQFRVILIQFGQTGGMDFFDRVVTPFINQLARNGQKREALSMAKLARQRINPPSGSMLEKALEKLIDSLGP